VVSLFAAEINAAIHARRLVPVEESLDVRVGDHTQPG